MRGVKSFADDLVGGPGPVHGRVALLLRSVEGQPAPARFFTSGTLPHPPPAQEPALRVSRRGPLILTGFGRETAEILPGTPRTRMVLVWRREVWAPPADASEASRREVRHIRVAYHTK